MAETQNDIAQYQTDHDLLVRLDERVAGLVNSIEKLTQANKTKNEDHETRIRSLEQRQWLIAGAVTIIAFISPYLINAIFGV